MNVILFLATIFNVGFCQTIYKPFDDQELGFLQEGRITVKSSEITKRLITEKFTPKNGIENDFKTGLHYRSVENILSI